MNTLATLLAAVTGQPRYFPDFEWSRTLWTHNVFRALGMVFGEYYGIRPSVASWHDEWGNQHQVGYTFEAQLALVENAVRQCLRRNFAFKIVLVPQLQLAGMRRGNIPYRLAIAFDAASGNQTNAAAGTNPALSHTCTGTNLALLVSEAGDINASNTITGITYNSVAMSNIDALRYPADRWIVSYMLAGPSTGANNIVSSGNTFGSKSGVSYTGVNQSNTPDSHAITNPASATTQTWSTNVVTTGCWLWGFAYGDMTPPTATAGTGTTLRGTASGSGSQAVDSNGTVGTGSQSLQVNQASNTPAVLPIISFAPVASGGGTTTIIRPPVFFN